MERESDVQLIQKILSGDEAAFGVLVEKHQKSVHALAWRKIGDFHDAEEITQDTFLQVYKKLPTLKDPYKFAGWLYVIANRLCLDWIRKKNLGIQSLEDTPVEEVEKASYTHHVSEQSEMDSSERRREIVKKLLAKLPESERTVMTLHYLGEMTVKEISKFLGVSVSAIHNRLYRARKRLKAQEERFVQEVLSSVQIPISVKENIMRRAADVKLAPSPASKPLLPWAAVGTAVVLVALLLGVSNQHLIRFQRPYSFEASSEPTIEIVDTAIVLDIASKPAVRNQVGRAVNAAKSSNAGLQTFASDAIPNASEDSLSVSETHWMPDPALRQAVREKLDIPADVPLTPAYLQQHLTSLDVRYEGIVDLTGLEHATDLQALVLIENEISDLSPLSGLMGLGFLDLGGNQISDLRPLAALTRLETLHIWRNRIEDISPLAGLVNLKKLLIENNAIKDFSPLDVLSHLEVVNINGNFRVGDYISRIAVGPRIKERGYPSIFAAGSGNDILNLPNLSDDEKLIYHDLFWGGLGFHLQWHPTPEEFRLFGRIDDAYWKREYLLSQNPNFIRLVSLDYTDTDPGDYPEDWPYWIRDENGNRVRASAGDSDLLIDFTHPVVQDILVQKAIAVAKCGLYDGIFLGGWQEDQATLNTDKGVYYRSVEAEWSARISMVRRIREIIGDDFLIIVKTHQRKAPLSAPYVNGMFMEAILDEQDTGYTHAGLRAIENTLLWSEQNFREPQINALKGRGISLEPADSPRNQQTMRVITTLSLTHSDGYVCYDIGVRGITHEHEYEILPGHERAHIEGKSHDHNHQHYWYPFWDAPLGRPMGEKAQLYHNSEGHGVDGLFIREFTNGWAVYNRSGTEQDIQLRMQATGVASGIIGVNHTLSDLDGEIYLK